MGSRFLRIFDIRGVSREGHVTLRVLEGIITNQILVYHVTTFNGCGVGEACWVYLCVYGMMSGLVEFIVVVL